MLAALKDFKLTKRYLVGIDSDVCAFDTMELKQKECFIPQIILSWRLQAISKYVREVAEFVNLYSRWRGINRFPALIKTVELLQERPEVRLRQVAFPNLNPLSRFVTSGQALSNPALNDLIGREADPILVQALAWSEAVNRSIEEMVHGVPPFPHVRESLERLSTVADIVVVSATPQAALEREWKEHGIAQFVGLICGQEAGTKKAVLSELRARQPAQLLMLGDAPGDLEAAKAVNALFYPINPGEEDRSWERFFKTDLDRFLCGSYLGNAEREAILNFESRLPATPPWT